MIPQLFLDLDGVLADTSGFYKSLFGFDLTWTDKDFPNIKSYKTFYRDQPLTSDAMELWDGIQQYHPRPIIITGIPHSVKGVDAQKKEWVREHFGDTNVICCRSRDKFRYAYAGDVLVDDRTKYSHLWTNGGGIFVLHKSAKESLAVLAAIYAGTQNQETMP